MIIVGLTLDWISTCTEAAARIAAANLVLFLISIATLFAVAYHFSVTFVVYLFIIDE
jgi:hypothetical protein